MIMHDESEIETDAIATDRRHLALDFLISSIVVAFLTCIAPLSIICSNNAKKHVPRTAFDSPHCLAVERIRIHSLLAHPGGVVISSAC